METLGLRILLQRVCLHYNNKQKKLPMPGIDPLTLHDWKSSIVTYKQNCITPDLWYFYLFNLEAVV